jgi:hypothetical protein
MNCVAPRALCELLSSRLWLKIRGRNEPRSVAALPRRTVKQNRIILGFPNCRQFDGSGTVETEENATRFSAPKQDPFSDLKNVNLQFMVIANGFMNIAT